MLVFTDGAGLIDPRTARPADWVEQFGAWEIRALLTPLPPASWTAREADLAAAGFLVEPATPDGLVDLAARIAARDGEGPGGRVTADTMPVPPLPGPLRDEPERWLDATMPPVDAVEHLVRDLRWYLGGDLDWLAACAAYPELRWDLTLEMGRVLTEADDRPRVGTSALARLARLPWFRHGALPDWLRLRLLTDLTPDRQDLIRRTINQLLLGAKHAEGVDGGIGSALEITLPAGGDGALGALARGLRRRLARRRTTTARSTTTSSPRSSTARCPARSTSACRHRSAPSSRR